MAPIAVLLWGTLWLVYHTETEAKKTLIKIKEKDHVRLQLSALTSHFHNVISDLGILSESHELLQLAEGAPGYSLDDLKNDLVSFSLKKKIYDQIRYIDKGGMEMVRIDYNNGKPFAVEKNSLQNKAGRYYFTSSMALGKGENFISSLDLNIENGAVEKPFKPVIRLGAPIFGPGGEKNGVLILNYLASGLLAKFKAVSKDSLGENSLLNAKGYWLSSAQPGNEWGFMFENGKDKTYSRDFPNAWKIISEGDSGQFMNAKGLFTFSTFYPIITANKHHIKKSIDHDHSIRDTRKWKIAAFVSSAEFDQEVTKKAGKLLDDLAKLYALIIVLAGGGAFALVRAGAVRRKAEKELLLSVIKYRELFDNATEMIVTIGLKGKIQSANKAAERMVGYSIDEILTMNISDLMTPVNMQKVMAMVEKKLKGDAKTVYELEIMTKENETLKVEVSSTIIYEDGRPVGSQAFVRDITERKRAEEELKKYRDHLEEQVEKRTAEVRRLYEAIEQSGEMVVITDTDGVIEYANLATARTTGYDKKELIGGKSSLLNSGKHDHAFYEKLWSTILGGEMWNGAIINKKKSGELYYEEMTISPLKNNAGEITHFIAIKRDISERIKAEETLKAAKDEAEKANRAKSVFLSSMSHELRTPLNAILGFAQLIMTDKKKPPSASQKNSLSHILLSGDHLLELINEVLDLSKIDAGKLNISPVDFALEPAINEVIVTAKQLAIKRKIKIHRYKEEKAWFIRADLTRFRQVMLNLVSNAVKYNCEEGKVTITVEPAGEKMLRINVSDTGHGIPDNKLDMLFEPFARFGSETSAIEGTGIGLTITKRLVKAMGGEIGLESVIGKGTRFYIDFPKGDEEKARASEGRETQDERGTKNGEKAKTLLYVEDDTTNLALVKNILERRPNISIRSAERGKEGLEIAFDKKPDIILLDIDLPDMNGYEVLTRLKTSDKTSGVPVVAVSANAMPSDIEKGKSAGFDDYITKPINVRNFLEIIDTLLG